ncbi:MAG: GGDEF domain-containing protein [Lachnospiraceae bacterium]|nr:GGDEF domain-containing protein [Lachnospiraceae bacterium]
MQHKNIAVLMTALDSDAQAQILKGIEEYAKGHGCNVAVFLWFTGAFEKDKHNMGEISIIDLPDLSLFDGIILFSDTLHMANNRRKIEDMLESLPRPLVCISCNVKNSPRVRSESYTAMKQLVEHYITDHGFKRIHFVKGVAGNEDAELRFKAYVDALTEHNIPVIPERITQGDFYVTGGELAAKEILSSNLPFPEVIVCANDVMATTICDILVEKGYHIPEDVMVSGYDNTLEGQMHYPKLTTVRIRSKDIGETACSTLWDMMEGKRVEKEHFLPDEVILNESCGCHKKVSTNTEELHRTYGGVSMVQRKLIHQMIKLEKNIIASNGYEEWLGAVKEFISQINPPEFYFCANEGFAENVFELGAVEQEDMSVEEKLAYTKKVDVILAYRSGMCISKPSFASKLAFEDLFQDTENGKLYIFSPIHYLERTFGYVVFVDSTFPVANQMYVSWLINMGDSIENIRKQSLLRNAMKRLDEMYIRDSLTGVYNRFGMERFFAGIKKKCLVSQMLLLVSFVDIDGLKKINDQFGHEEGDRIITITAEILQKRSSKYFVVRYGGDEFIVMGNVHGAREVEEYWEGVMEDVALYNQTTKKYADLSISYGYDIFKMDTTTYLEDCIRVTDKKMYLKKRQKRTE